MKKNRVAYSPSRGVHRIILRGKERATFNCLSPEAEAQIQRHEDAARRALANAGMVRIR